MKNRLSPLLSALLLSVPCGLAMAPGAQAAPEACSISVGIAVRSGLSYRTWTNALETIALSEKGLNICQDDGILNVSDEEAYAMTEEKAAALLKCKTEFSLELLYRPDNRTRNITITNRKGEILFDQDYPNSPPSQRILRTIPTCSALQTLDQAVSARE